jgi:ADP-heptose:LPS heptosyltransferase
LNVAIQRFVDRYVGIPLCAALSLFERIRPARRPFDPSTGPNTVVVILLSEMGSLVLAHAMFERLRHRYPGSSLRVVLFAKNREALDLLRVVPDGSAIEIDDRSAARLLVTLGRAVRTLRQIRPDVVIDCELFARISSILSYVSSAPVRVGFHRGTQEGLYRGSTVNRPVLYNPYQHISRQFLALADAIGSASWPLAKNADLSAQLAAPDFIFEPGEVDDVAAQLCRDFPALRDRRLVLVYPGGGILPIRAWPLANFAELCEALRDDGCAIGIIGLAADRPLAEQLTARLDSPRCVNLAGYTRSVRHLLALFRAADLLVTNDGGPGQFSALTPIPTIALFGPETPLLYGSHATNAHVFYRALPCSPCLTAYNHRNSPCDGDNQCLKQIAPAAVLAKSRELLSNRAATRNVATEEKRGA